MKQSYTIGMGDAAVARKALAGEPILVYPLGTHHRPDWDGNVRTWTVDEGIVAALVENFERREERGIRQARLPVNEDHQSSRALGWFNQVMPVPGGLGATFTWNAKGREALQAGEFSYFSIEIYDEIVDRVTGEKIEHQVAGGALTNYPFFGEATSLMSRTDHTGGNHMTQTHDQETPWLREQFEQLLQAFGRQQPASTAPKAPAPPDLAPLRDEFSRELAAVRAEIGAVQSERDTYARRVAQLEEQLTATQDARAREQYTRMAQEFAHLPAQAPDLAAHLRWLHETDGDGEHAAFFKRLLTKADAAFSRQFKELGLRRTHTGAEDPETQLDTLAKAYSAEHGVSYRDAAAAVLAQRPDLHQSYHESIGGEA